MLRVPTAFRGIHESPTCVTSPRTFQKAGVHLQLAVATIKFQPVQPGVQVASSGQKSRQNLAAGAAHPHPKTSALLQVTWQVSRLSCAGTNFFSIGQPCPSLPFQVRPFIIFCYKYPFPPGPARPSPIVDGEVKLPAQAADDTVVRCAGSKIIQLVLGEGDGVDACTRVPVLQVEPQRDVQLPLLVLDDGQIFQVPLQKPIQRFQLVRVQQAVVNCSTMKGERKKSYKKDGEVGPEAWGQLLGTGQVYQERFIPRSSPL